MELLKNDLIIFDLDKTLVNIKVNYDNFKTEFFNVIKDKYDIPYPHHFNLTVNYNISLNNIKVKKIAINLLKKYEYNCKYEVMPKTIELINHLKNKKLALLTNNLKSTAIYILKDLDLLQYFKIILGSESVLRTKPDPIGVVAIIKGLNIEKEKSCFIGDSAVDKSTAFHSKIDFYHISDIYKYLEELNNE
ncbi:MAG: HAD-IA family hydrolase [Patescibacteria group bacterium]